MNFTPWHTVIPSASSERQLFCLRAQHPQFSPSPTGLLGGLDGPIFFERAEMFLQGPIRLFRVVHELSDGHRIECQGIKDEGPCGLAITDPGRDLPVIDPPPAVGPEVLE